MTDQEEIQLTGAPVSVEVTINGKTQLVEAGTTIGGFLTAKGYRVTMIIVELNGEIVPRESYADTLMRAGDRIEMVHAVGGG